MFENGGMRDALLTLIGKCAEQVGTDHLHGSLQHSLLDDIVCGFRLIEHVNDLNEALFLGFFEINVLLCV